MQQALQLLLGTFPSISPPSSPPSSTGNREEHASCEPSTSGRQLLPAADLAASVAAFSSHGNLVVPDPRHRKLPLHVLANERPQPWLLLPMRAAALQRYPDFFGQSALFFSSLQGAVLKGASRQLLRPSKVGCVLLLQSCWNAW